MRRIDLLRHGESQWSNGYLRGSIDDELSVLGWAQMSASIQPQLEQGCPWQVVFSSPLQRCRLFAEDVAKQQQRALYLDPNLQEIHFGDWEGESTQALYDRIPSQLAEFWQQPTQFTPPNGEPLLVFQQRVLSAIQHIHQQMVQSNLQHALVVTHGGVIKLLKTIALAQPLDRLLSMSAELGQLHHFELDVDAALYYQGIAK